MRENREGRTAETGALRALHTAPDHLLTTVFNRATVAPQLRRTLKNGLSDMRNLLIISLSIWGCLLATACTFDSSALLERTPCELDQDCPGGVCIEQFCFFGEVLDPADVALTPDSFNLDTGLVPDTGGDTSANDTDSDTSATICSPGIARCNGTVLEVCSGDGTELTEVDCAESECDDPRGLGCVCARGTCTGRVCERGRRSAIRRAPAF